MLVELTIVSDHVQLLLNGNVAEGLLDLIVAGEEDNPLLGAQKRKLVLAGLIERG